MSAVYDKTGRAIEVGDILKVYHFTGARWRKRYYMYKQVKCIAKLGKNDTPYYFVSHLNLTEAGYYIGLNEGVLSDYEIVQSVKADFHDRPKKVLDKVKKSRYNEE